LFESTGGRGLRRETRPGQEKHRTRDEYLFLERSDRAAVRWSYGEFRRAYPGVDTDAGIQAVGYQILKMGDIDSAIALLEANAHDHPDSSGAAFGLGRPLLLTFLT
jgi:hypothetical protein